MARLWSLDRSPATAKPDGGKVKGMSRYVVERIRFLERFVRDRDISPIRADRLATDWEFEANRRGADTRASSFWRNGRAWMEARLERRNPGRHEGRANDG